MPPSHAPYAAMLPRQVVWQRVHDACAVEFCSLEPQDDGVLVHGRIVAHHEDVPALVDYRLDCSPDLRSCRALELERWLGGERRTLSLRQARPGEWQVDRKPAPWLNGCTDVDIEWTPATNLFPIRRLPDTTGASLNVMAAWVRLPGLAVQAAPQCYERLAPRRCRYTSRDSGFSAEIAHDGHGLPLDYGDVWRSVCGIGASA